MTDQTETAGGRDEATAQALALEVLAQHTFSGTTDPQIAGCDSDEEPCTCGCPVSDWTCHHVGVLADAGLLADPEQKYGAQALAEKARDAAYAERDQLKARIDAALERHSRDTDGSCKGCGLDAYEEPIAWPCATVRALQGDQPAEVPWRCCIGPFTDGTHAPGCLQACQDCGGDETGPRRCRCRDATSPPASPSTVDSGEAAAKLTDPNGCRHCGAPERTHYRRYTDSVGWHQWTAPDDPTRLARMRARRDTSTPHEPPAPFVPAADAFPEVTDG